MSVNYNKRRLLVNDIKSEILFYINHYAELKKTHNDFIALHLQLTYDNKDYQKLPEYKKSEIQGYWDACFKLLVDKKLIFMYQWTDGKFYTTKELEQFDDFTHYKLAVEVKKLHGFMWDENHPFSVSIRE